MNDAAARIGPTLLVVDDDEAMRLLCRLSFAIVGYRVLEAASVDEAASVLGEEPVDVVLLDVVIGDENGLSFLRELRKQGNEVPVAIFTGSTTLDEQDVAFADAVLRKPFALDELTAIVARLVAGGDPATRKVR